MIKPNFSQGILICITLPGVCDCESKIQNLIVHAFRKEHSLEIYLKNTTHICLTMVSTYLIITRPDTNF